MVPRASARGTIVLSGYIWAKRTTMAVKFQGGKSVPQVTMDEAKSVGRVSYFVNIADRAIQDAAQVMQEGARFVPAAVLSEYQQIARVYVDVMEKSARAKKMLEATMKQLDANRK